MSNGTVKVGDTATNPTTGQRVRFDGENWAPLQRKEGYTESLLSTLPGGGTTSLKDVATIGVPHMVKHPIDSVTMLIQAMAAAQAGETEKAKAFWKQSGFSNKGLAAAHFLYAAIPFFGPLLGQAATQFENNNFSGGFGTMTGTLGQMLLNSPKVRASIASRLESAAKTRGPLEIGGTEVPVTKGQVGTGTLRPAIEQGMARSFAGKPLQKLFETQENLGKQIIAKTASDAVGGSPVNPDDFIGSVGNASKQLRTAASQEYANIAHDLSGTKIPKRGVTKIDLGGGEQYLIDQKTAAKTGGDAGELFRDLVRQRSDASDKVRSYARRGNWKDWHDSVAVRDALDGELEQLMEQQQKPELFARYQKAKADYNQSHAIEDLQDVFDSVTSGFTKAQQEGTAMQARPQKIDAIQAVEKIKTLDSRLEQAVGRRGAQAIRQTTELLSRGKGTNMVPFAHHAMTWGPILGAVGEASYFKNPVPALEHMVGLYGGLWLISKAMVSRGGRAAVLRFLSSSVGSPAEAQWRSIVLGSAAAASTGRNNGTQKKEEGQKERVAVESQ